jgi:hypothetical protein
MSNLKTLASAGLAVILGGIGLVLVFSDVGAGEPARSRIIVAAIFFLLSAGLVILLVPASLALLGGYIGRRLSGRRAEQTV